MRIGSAFLALVSLSFFCELFGQPQAEDSSRSLISRIAPGFAIVTQLSADRIYLGQQFSVLYRLEAANPPLAVDVDPQQFSGFWSEIAPLNEGASAHNLVAGAGENHRYWLRQVIAYPLLEGILQLPPLQIKIKTSQSVSRAPDGWDIIRTSDPPKITVISPFKIEEAKDPYPLVGALEGKMSRVLQGGRTVASLELWGTANLDLFQVTEYLRAPANIRLSVELSDRENRVQTQDIGGRRSISMLQRRRWIIRTPWNSSVESRIEDINLQFFDIRKGSWNTKLIEGIGMRSNTANFDAQEEPTSFPKNDSVFANGLLSLLYRYHLWLACLFALIIIVVAIRFLRRGLT